MNRMRQAIREAALASAQITSGNGEQSFCFSEDFLGFAGHFPDYPILPAILQTLLAQIVAEQVVDDALQFQSLKRAKFTRQIRPGEKIDVSVNCTELSGQLRCDARLRVGDASAAGFTILFTQGVSS